MELNQRNLSTVLISLILLGLFAVIAFLIQNPTYIGFIIGLPLYVKFGAFILVVLAAVWDTYNPRIQAMIAGTEVVVLDRGHFISFIVGFGSIIATVVVMNPDILNPILGVNGLQYASVIVGVAGLYLKFANPRNQNIPIDDSSQDIVDPNTVNPIVAGPPSEDVAEPNLDEIDTSREA